MLCYSPIQNTCAAVSLLYRLPSMYFFLSPMWGSASGSGVLLCFVFHFIVCEGDCRSAERRCRRCGQCQFSRLCGWWAIFTGQKSRILLYICRVLICSRSVAFPCCAVEFKIYMEKKDGGREEGEFKLIKIS